MAKADMRDAAETDRHIQTRLREVVAKIAGAIDRGECSPTDDELETMATVCDDNGLRDEAARVRRWIPR